jgi:hypothetical protein
MFYTARWWQLRQCRQRGSRYRALAALFGSLKTIVPSLLHFMMARTKTKTIRGCLVGVVSRCPENPQPALQSFNRPSTHDSTSLAMSWATVRHFFMECSLYSVALPRHFSTSALMDPTMAENMAHSVIPFELLSYCSTRPNLRVEQCYCTSTED